jgi:hypothetical protein
MTTTTLDSSLSALAAAPVATSATSGSADGSGDWFQAMAQAWSNTLDNEANKISSMSDSIGSGQDDPEAITMLTTESLRMGYLSDSSHTSLNSVGQALDTMARKG